jgi:Mrp family chromosome partitioning ATPase
MEKIQSALAKARAEREEAQTAGGVLEKPVKKQAQAAVGTISEAQPETEADPASKPVPAPVSSQTAASIDATWKALPLLNVQPKLMTRNRIVALQGGQEAAGIDIIRTRVLQQMRDNGWRRLAITSPTASCGKSTIALNLAMSLQRQSDLRTVLMELDLRRPSLARMLGIKDDLSFAHVLEGTRPFAENSLRHGSNLAVSTNQRPWRDAAELLGGVNVSETLSEIEQNYAPDLMIFDMPPMLVSDDMMAFARHVDCVLLIAGAEASTVKEIDICETDLASQTNVMGVVLNKCRYMGEEYGYGYYE